MKAPSEQINIDERLRGLSQNDRDAFNDKIIEVCQLVSASIAAKEPIYTHGLTHKLYEAAIIINDKHPPEQLEHVAEALKDRHVPEQTYTPVKQQKKHVPAVKDVSIENYMKDMSPTDATLVNIQIGLWRTNLHKRQGGTIESVKNPFLQNAKPPKARIHDILIKDRSNMLKEIEKILNTIEADLTGAIKPQTAPDLQNKIELR